MCLILCAYDTQPGYRLILAANRDEFYQRPAQQAHFWEEQPAMLGGKDLEGGGTWLGVTRQGRMAALTNYRDPAAVKTAARSRGLLVKEFLVSALSPQAYAEHVYGAREQYNGFNLLLFAAGELWYYSNYAGVPQRLSAGIYGLSNQLMDTAWPKVATGKARLAGYLRKNGRVDAAELLTLLADPTPATDEQLPDTGMGYAGEKLLSSMFIQSETYGTRVSTALVISTAGEVDFIERPFGVLGRRIGIDIRISFNCRENSAPVS